MLSILIPTYNYDCSNLVSQLCKKAEELTDGFEIIVADDASTQSQLSSRVAQLDSTPCVRVFMNKENRGRAGIRNFMAEQARGEWLLFIDSDAEVPEDFSLKTYLEAGREADVVCGGLLHPKLNPSPEATLRFLYERDADKRRNAANRMQNPYAQIATFSLMVRRKVFLTIRFDEQCREYGYEDTLFGAELEKRKLRVCHIDNPLIHTGLEPNDVYLQKTETALHTLKRIESRMQGHSALLQCVTKLRRWHLAGIVKCAYKLFRRTLRRNLLGCHPSLKAFAFYKLGYYLTL